MDGSSSASFEGMSLVMSYSLSKKAFDIQFKFTKTFLPTYTFKPEPFRVFDYYSKATLTLPSSPNLFLNDDFSNLLGVSSKSKQ